MAAYNKSGEYKNHRQVLTDNIIDSIKKETAPWQKPWPKGFKKERPLNIVSKKEYKGGNLLSLSSAPYGDPRWLTFKQAAKKGWNVNQGEKGTYVEYINWYDVKKEKDEITGEEKNVYVQRERPIISRAVVFNGEQVDGMPVYTNKLTENLPEKEIVDAAQKLIENSGAAIIFDAPGEAWYDMAKDEIHISPKESFNSTYDMYSTILHELAHWTAHSSRLDRKKAAVIEDTTEYAREELRAEIASYFMAFDLGVGATQKHIDNHASFTKSWLDLLGGNRNEIYRVAKDAENICLFIYNNFLEKALQTDHIDIDTAAVEKNIDVPVMDIKVIERPVVTTVKERKTTVAEGIDCDMFDDAVHFDQKPIKEDKMPEDIEDDLLGDLVNPKQREPENTEYFDVDPMDDFTDKEPVLIGAAATGNNDLIDDVFMDF